MLFNKFVECEDEKVYYKLRNNYIINYSKNLMEI